MKTQRCVKNFSFSRFQLLHFLLPGFGFAFHNLFLIFMFFACYLFLCETFVEFAVFGSFCFVALVLSFCSYFAQCSAVFALTF